MKYISFNSSASNSINVLAMTTPITLSTTVNAPGIAFAKTLDINRPLTISLFGSRAKMKDGIPIVTAPMTVMSVGSKGRPLGISIKMRANKKLYMVLTIYRAAERSRLLMLRLPSATTFGIDAKLLSSKTRLETFFAASLPEAMATEQSASFRARTSFTPSPVIATVCFFFLSDLTSNSFWSGVTLPNIVYLSAASMTSSSVVRVERSI